MTQDGRINRVNRTERAQVEAKISALEDERDMYRDLAKDLYNPYPCELSSDGVCNEHSPLLAPGIECPDGRAQRMFIKGGRRT